ncbi:hypothetical protein GCM10009430_32470 [Aquimarina litoralis]|uniref:DUF4848 domain-containing protein n=1 Tax=Aquimarina litoralis TaxID=584605 RepID=A0ABN1J1N5_9FLAO
MKNHFINLFLVTTILFSCQKEDIDITEETGDAKIEYLAKNFYEPQDENKIHEIVNAYNELNYEEMKKFINYSYTNDTEKGMSVEDAALKKSFMLELNELSYSRAGKSLALVDDQNADAFFEELSQKEKYKTFFENQDNDVSSKTARCYGGNWYRSKTLPWVGNSVYYINWPVYANSRVNFQGTSSDCDYLFKSQPYNIYYKTGAIVAQTPAAANVFAYGGELRVPCREPQINSREAQLEFLLGFGRVARYYSFNGGWNTFASHVKISLVRR